MAERDRQRERHREIDRGRDKKRERGREGIFSLSGMCDFVVVAPFRPQVEDLIDWTKAPDDPMFQLVFPQPGMLSPKDLQRSVSALLLWSIEC